MLRGRSMKNSVPILQTLRSGGKCQQGNSKMGNSPCASFLAGVTFCFLCILPFLSADLLCPLKKVHPQGLSIIWWNLTLNLLRLSKTVPMTPAEGLQPPPGVPAPPPAEFSTSRFLPPAASRAVSPRACEGPCSGRSSPPQCPLPSGQLGSYSGLCGPRTFPFETWSCLGTKGVPSSHQGTGFTNFCHEPASTDPQGCALTPKVNSCFTSAILFYSKGNFSTF